jgi:hypothetical protein
MNLNINGFNIEENSMEDFLDSAVFVIIGLISSGFLIDYTKYNMYIITISMAFFLLFFLVFSIDKSWFFMGLYCLTYVVSLTVPFILFNDSLVPFGVCFVFSLTFLLLEVFRQQ